MTDFETHAKREYDGLEDATVKIDPQQESDDSLGIEYGSLTLAR